MIFEACVDSVTSALAAKDRAGDPACQAKRHLNLSPDPRSTVRPHPLSPSPVQGERERIGKFER